MQEEQPIAKSHINIALRQTDFESFQTDTSAISLVRFCGALLLLQLRSEGGRISPNDSHAESMHGLHQILVSLQILFHKDIIYVYCTGKAATPFYYIVVLVQLTLLTPWLVRMKNRRWLYMVTPIYLVILYIYNLATGSMPRLYETVFPAWFSFYVLGLDCRSGKWVNVCRRAKNWWIAAVLGLSIIEAFVLLRAGCAIGFVSSQIRFGSFL